VWRRTEQPSGPRSRARPCRAVVRHCSPCPLAAVTAGPRSRARASRAVVRRCGPCPFAAETAEHPHRAPPRPSTRKHPSVCRDPVCRQQLRPHGAVGRHLRRTTARDARHSDWAGGKPYIDVGRQPSGPRSRARASRAVVRHCSPCPFAAETAGSPSLNPFKKGSDPFKWTGVAAGPTRPDLGPVGRVLR
jgi:hypothetical protein